MSAMTQLVSCAAAVAPLGWAIASPAPSAAVVTTMAVQGSRRSAARLWLASAASTSVTGSSMMKIGCTRAIGPVASAAAWATAATMTMPMPASHTRRLTRSAISETCMDRSGGTWAAALRCRTAAQALLPAVSSANRTHSSVCTPMVCRCTWILASSSVLTPGSSSAPAARSCLSWPVTRSANGRRLARLSPRFSRHAHSRRMAEAKPILIASLNISSE